MISGRGINLPDLFDLGVHGGRGGRLVGQTRTGRQGARGTHPVQWLVCTVVGMDTHRVVRLDDDEPLRPWQMGRETTCVVNLAGSNDETHGVGLYLHLSLDLERHSGAPAWAHPLSIVLPGTRCGTMGRMGRHHGSRKWQRRARPLSATSHPHSEYKRDGQHVVRMVPADRALKVYTCPGCLHPIQPGTPHVVAWPHEPSMFSTSPVEERRHWHTGCWRSRP